MQLLSLLLFSIVVVSVQSEKPCDELGPTWVESNLYQYCSSQGPFKQTSTNQCCYDKSQICRPGYKYPDGTPQVCRDNLDCAGGQDCQYNVCCLDDARQKREMQSADPTTEDSTESTTTQDTYEVPFVRGQKTAGNCVGSRTRSSCSLPELQKIAPSPYVCTDNAHAYCLHNECCDVTNNFDLLCPGGVLAVPDETGEFYYDCSKYPWTYKYATNDVCCPFFAPYSIGELAAKSNMFTEEKLENYKAAEEKQCSSNADCKGGICDIATFPGSFVELPFKMCFTSRTFSCGGKLETPASGFGVKTCTGDSECGDRKYCDTKSLFFHPNAKDGAPVRTVKVCCEAMCGVPTHVPIGKSAGSLKPTPIGSGIAAAQFGRSCRKNETGVSTTCQGDPHQMMMLHYECQSMFNKEYNNVNAQACCVYERVVYPDYCPQGHEILRGPDRISPVYCTGKGSECASSEYAASCILPEGNILKKYESVKLPQVFPPDGKGTCCIASSHHVSGGEVPKDEAHCSVGGMLKIDVVKEVNGFKCNVGSKCDHSLLKTTSGNWVCVERTGGNFGCCPNDESEITTIDWKTCNTSIDCKGKHSYCDIGKGKTQGVCAVGGLSKQIAGIKCNSGICPSVDGINARFVCVGEIPWGAHSGNCFLHPKDKLSDSYEAPKVYSWGAAISFILGIVFMIVSGISFCKYRSKHFCDRAKKTKKPIKKSEPKDTESVVESVKESPKESEAESAASKR